MAYSLALEDRRMDTTIHATPSTFRPARRRVAHPVPRKSAPGGILDDYDRRRYLHLMVQHAMESAVRIIGYCQMTNHAHLVAMPTTDGGLSRFMARLNSEYAQMVQFRASRCGHLWQGRFQSTAMDEAHLWNALRYVELNPVRVGIVQTAEDWAWSSAGVHLGLAKRPEWLDEEIWQRRWDCQSWQEFLNARVDPEEEGRIRRATRENRPLAEDEQVREWERSFGIRLFPGKPGRPRTKTEASEPQLLLFRAAAR